MVKKSRKLIVAISRLDNCSAPCKTFMIDKTHFISPNSLELSQLLRLGISLKTAICFFLPFISSHSLCKYLFILSNYSGYLFSFKHLTLLHSPSVTMLKHSRLVLYGLRAVWHTFADKNLGVKETWTLCHYQDINSRFKIMKTLRPQQKFTVMSWRLSGRSIVRYNTQTFHEAVEFVISKKTKFTLSNTKKNSSDTFLSAPWCSKGDPFSATLSFGKIEGLWKLS